MGGAEVQKKGNAIHTNHPVARNATTLNEPLCASARTASASDGTGDTHALYCIRKTLSPLYAEKRSNVTSTMKK